MVSIPGEALLNRGVAGYFIPCALVLEKNPTERVQFESFPAEEGITEGYNADYAKLGDKYSGEPIRRTWQGGDWNPISITLNFRAGLNPLEIGPIGVAIGRMLGKVNWLKASTFPRPDTYTPAGKKALPSGAKSAGASKASGILSGLAGRPPYVLFVWGLFMTLRGRIPAWTVQWQGPYEPISGKPHGAIVTLTFQPESGFFPNWYSVRDTGGGNTPASVVSRFI
jgi:hypothetical protein